MSENLVQYVVAAGNGDTDAMAKLYSKTLKATYFLASKLSENESDAVEIIKKAYARAFCSIDKLKMPEAFEIWLKQIVAAIYKDGANFIFNDADGNAQEASAEFLPEAILEDEAMAAKVGKAISALSAERKAALILHYYTGMPSSALARYFGVSESTANAILAKAKADVSANSGISAPDYPELATLPVLTRLFKDAVAKMGIDNTVVRDVFVFAVEAYTEAKAQAAAPANEPVEEVAQAKEEPVAEEKAEESVAEAVEETVEETAEEPAETEEVTAEAEEAVEEAEEVEEVEETADETEEGEEKEETVEEMKNEMEENILSFKNKISSMLGTEPETVPEEETTEEIAEEPEAEEVVEEETTAEETTEEESDAMPIDDDAFERIKRSIEDMAGEVQADSVAESDDENALVFADFAETKEEPVAEPEEDAAQTQPAEKPAKKAVKINSKIIIAAAVILVVIVVAVALIVKGGKGKDEAVTEPTTVGYSNESVNWVALPELSDYEEIEYLNESFNSFKDPDTGKYGLIDYKGNVVLEAKYDGFRRCSNGRYYGEGKLSDSGYHIVAEKGGNEFEVVMLDESSATLSNSVHTSHATTNSTSMGGGDYDERDRYYEGYAAVRKNGKWGYVAQGGKIVVPYEFEAVNNIPTDDAAGSFDYCRGSVNGYVAVKKDGKMGIIRIDKDSYRIVADYKYDMICQGKNGVFLAYNGTEWGNIVIGSAAAESGSETEVTTLKPVETQPAEVSIGKYVVLSDETNIRSAPDTEKENIVAALDEGYEISALEIKKGSNGSDWVRFDYNGQEAWVSIKKLDKVN